LPTGVRIVDRNGKKVLSRDSLAAAGLIAMSLSKALQS